jgi:hypothetical protein
MRRTGLSTLATRALTFLVALAAMLAGSPSSRAVTFELEAKLLAEDGSAQDLFGHAVAIDGDTAVVGAYGADVYGEKSGAAYVFTRTNGNWSQEAKLVPDDGEAEERFGHAVAVSGDTAMVGAPWDDENYSYSGSVYVFTRTSGVWMQTAKILPADGWQDDYFGQAIALEGDTALIGAHGHDDAGYWAGAVYEFTSTGDVWTETQKLVPEDADGGQNFGSSIDLHGDQAVIGAPHWAISSPGSAYVFTRTDGGWVQQAKLVPQGSGGRDRFGWSVALHGDTSLIAAPFDSPYDEFHTVYVFERTGGVWTETESLYRPGDFGVGLELEGDLAIVGFQPDGDTSVWDSVFLFTRMSDSLWLEEDQYQPTDLGDQDCFGCAIENDGDTVIVGASGDPWETNRGSAYVLRLVSDDGDDGGDVPASGVIGRTLLLLAVLGTGVYFSRRRTAG